MLSTTALASISEALVFTPGAAGEQHTEPIDRCLTAFSHNNRFSVAVTKRMIKARL